MTTPLIKSAKTKSLEWRVSATPEPYDEAIAAMESRVDAILAGTAPELVWLLEHPPLYTAGTSADEGELIAPARFPVYQTGRGGRYTYHGPGQRVVYVVADLRRRGQDLRAHIRRLEELVVRVLADFGVAGELREGRVGIWVAHNNAPLTPTPLWGANSALFGKQEDSPSPHTCGGRGVGVRGELPKKATIREEKIAAIGVRVRKWVAYHGLALNVNPDLEHFSGIVPCGLQDYGVTSLHALGIKASMREVDEAFRKNWDSVFEF